MHAPLHLPLRPGAQASEQESEDEQVLDPFGAPLVAPSAAAQLALTFRQQLHLVRGIPDAQRLSAAVPVLDDFYDVEELEDPRDAGRALDDSAALGLGSVLLDGGADGDPVTLDPDQGVILEEEDDIDEVVQADGRVVMLGWAPATNAELLSLDEWEKRVVWGEDLEEEEEEGGYGARAAARAARRAAADGDAQTAGNVAPAAGAGSAGTSQAQGQQQAGAAGAILGDGPEAVLARREQRLREEKERAAHQEQMNEAIRKSVEEAVAAHAAQKRAAAAAKAGAGAPHVAGAGGEGPALTFPMGSHPQMLRLLPGDGVASHGKEERPAAAASKVKEEQDKPQEEAVSALLKYTPRGSLQDPSWLAQIKWDAPRAPGRASQQHAGTRDDASVDMAMVAANHPAPLLMHPAFAASAALLAPEDRAPLVLSLADSNMVFSAEHPEELRNAAAIIRAPAAPVPIKYGPPMVEGDEVGCWA